VSDVEEQLAWEAEQRPRASAVAIAAGVLTLLGNILLLVLFRNGPGVEDGFVSVSESLDARLQGRPVGEEALFLRQAQYYGDNALPFSLTTLLLALAVIGIGLTLAYLYRATAARASIGRLPIIMTIIGTVAFLVGRVVRDALTWIGTAGLSADATAEEVRDTLGSGTVLVGQLFEQIGSFALGVAFALVSLNAMRAGLLTRFLGILGVIIGIITVFPLDQTNIVRAFWLCSVGWVIIAGRGRAGLLPAWQTGRAEPWPTQQQLRERREAASGRTPAPAAEPAGAESVAAQQQRRKRKKRR
jgi:signal transduction histidine kinase